MSDVVQEVVSRDEIEAIKREARDIPVMELGHERRAVKLVTKKFETVLKCVSRADILEMMGIYRELGGNKALNSRSRVKAVDSYFDLLTRLFEMEIGKAGGGDKHIHGDVVMNQFDLTDPKVRETLRGLLDEAERT